jgi:hypothetical protein
MEQNVFIIEINMWNLASGCALWEDLLRVQELRAQGAETLQRRHMAVLAKRAAAPQ